MLNKEEAIEILKKELPYLKDKYGIKKIALFGSFAKEKQRNESDIDIIVEFERPIGLKFVELAEYVESILGRKVDILTPEGIKSIRVSSVSEDIIRSAIYV